MTKLMAPGGNKEMVVRSFRAGADSVYIGPRGWSRRRSEYEMSDSDIKECAAIANQMGKRIRIALNALPEAGRSDSILEKIATYMNWGITEFTINDFGYIRQIHAAFPQAFLNASVGCYVVNAEDARFLKDLGVSQIVPDCKLNLEELAQIRETGLGLEILIHASTCYTFIGSCWWGSYVRLQKTTDSEGNVKCMGSPNRGGLCWRICLKPWEFELAGHRVEKTMLRNNAFFMIDEIPELLRIGADMLKIQGREYSPVLVEEIVGFYRELLDCLQSGPELELDPEFDPDFWKGRLSDIRRRRDLERERTTNRLLEESGHRSFLRSESEASA